MGNDWSFTKIVMQECIITSASPTNAVISGCASRDLLRLQPGRSGTAQDRLLGEHPVMPPEPAPTPGTWLNTTSRW